MTDWKWEVKECAEQKDLFLDKRKNTITFSSPEERDRRHEIRQKRVNLLIPIY